MRVKFISTLLYGLILFSGRGFGQLTFRTSMYADSASSIFNGKDRFGIMVTVTNNTPDSIYIPLHLTRDTTNVFGGVEFFRDSIFQGILWFNNSEDEYEPLDLDSLITGTEENTIYASFESIYTFNPISMFQSNLKKTNIRMIEDPDLNSRFWTEQDSVARVVGQDSLSANAYNTFSKIGTKNIFTLKPYEIRILRLQKFKFKHALPPGKYTFVHVPFAGTDKTVYEDLDWKGKEHPVDYNKYAPNIYGFKLIKPTKVEVIPFVFYMF